MFYSETLLAKTGPLARVWLSANVERKLTKSHVISSDIKESVHAITDRGTAPMALRLSGQLLLGVVRIYSRKARYLLDDCNEAILKIKMAFRPGNVDLPANQSHTASAAALNMPDVLTEVDLLGPGPDLSMLLSQDEDPSLLLEPSQNILSDSLDRGRASSVFSNGFNPLASSTMRPIEVGRDAAQAMPDMSTMIEDDLPLDDDGIVIEDEPLDAFKPAGEPMGNDDMDDTTLHGANDQPMLDMDDPLPSIDDVPRSPSAAVEATSAPFARAPTRSESVLSAADAQLEADLDRSFRARSDLFALDDDQSFHAPQRAAKKRKVLHADTNGTQLPSAQIQAQQNDRSKILKPATYLPRDPVLLALMEMQKNGTFVSNILGDNLTKGWAPELRGVLSLEVVRSGGDLKRKRDSGVAGVDSPEEATPELDFRDAQEDLPEDFADRLEEPEPMIHLPADSDPAMPQAAEADEPLDAPGEDFDETTRPGLHPDDAGPVSLGTKHAVHMLRDALGGPEAESSPGKRVQGSVLFTDLCPEKTTTRADATKMFFETLVLATKDAVKVEQGGWEEAGLGGPMRLRAKRGLWGQWAEMGTESGREQVTT